MLPRRTCRSNCSLVAGNFYRVIKEIIELFNRALHICRFFLIKTLQGNLHGKRVMMGNLILLGFHFSPVTCRLNPNSSTRKFMQEHEAKFV